MLYGIKCCMIKSQNENKISVEDMRMLRCVCGKTRKDKIRIYNIDLVFMRVDKMERVKRI